MRSPASLLVVGVCVSQALGFLPNVSLFRMDLLAAVLSSLNPFVVAVSLDVRDAYFLYLSVIDLGIV